MMLRLLCFFFAMLNIGFVFVDLDSHNAAMAVFNGLVAFFCLTAAADA